MRLMSLPGMTLAKKIPPWLALLASLGTHALAIEEPGFKVVDTRGRVELRQYAAHLVAETNVKADFASAGNRGFRPLFNYISGNNRRQEKIEMTAPVSQSAQRNPGEKIEMTAPVTQLSASDGAGSYVIAFTMPARFTRESIPQPADDLVKIREIPSRTMAVINYSGTWGEERYAEVEKALRVEIAGAGWHARGPAEFARYDPPFMPWFLRRNEVMIEVEPHKLAPN